MRRALPLHRTPATDRLRALVPVGPPARKAVENEIGDVDFSAAGLDATGRTVGNTSFDVARRDLYPCRRPRNYGYGVKMCP